MSDEEVTKILSENDEIKIAGAKLIEKANENGGPDNITCVLVRIVE